MPFNDADYQLYEILLMGEFYAFFGWILMAAVRTFRLSRMQHHPGERTVSKQAAPGQPEAAADRTYRTSAMNGNYDGTRRRGSSAGKHDARARRSGSSRRQRTKYGITGAGFPSGPASAACWLGSMITILVILPLQAHLPKQAGFFLTLALMILLAMVLGYVGRKILLYWGRTGRRRARRSPLPWSPGYAALAGLAGFEAAYELQPHLKAVLGVLPLPLDWFLLLVFYLPFVFQTLNVLLGIQRRTPIANKRYVLSEKNRRK